MQNELKSLENSLLEKYHELIFVASFRRRWDFHIMRSALCLFLVLFAVDFSSPNLVRAAEPSALWSDWQEAKSFYDSGRWSDAAAQLLAHPRPNDSSYFYNLGSTYLKIGNLGLALAYLEKANRLRPHHPDIQNNLGLARQAFSEKVGSDKLDPASSWIEQLADQVSFDEVRGTLGFSLLALVLIWIRNYSKTRRIKGALSHPAAYLGMAALGITLGLYGIRLWANYHPSGILLGHQTVRSGPGDHFEQLAELEVGSKVRILGPVSSQTDEPHEDWNQIRFSKEQIGWVRSKDLLVL